MVDMVDIMDMVMVINTGVMEDIIHMVLTHILIIIVLGYLVGTVVMLKIGEFYGILKNNFYNYLKNICIIY